MKIQYTVHSIGKDIIDTPVEYQGHTIRAGVRTVTLELISDEPTQANPLLRLSPDDPLASLDIGAAVIGTFEPEAGNEEQP